jgi:membrane glycosyltransferase
MTAETTALPRKALTPTGLQSLAVLARRRAISAVVTAVVYVGLLVWLASILAVGGWSAIDVLIFACFAIAAPWSVLGVWNAALGFWLLHGSRNAMELVAPFAAAGDVPTPLAADIAVLMTLRNEDAARAFARLRAVKASVDATGEGARFGWFVLSDTDDLATAGAEQDQFTAWQARAGASRIFYRRRADNEGFKAGNLRDFCRRWGADYEFMIPLDADSLMDGDSILRLARIGQAYPRLGILQSLVVGAPATSGFARIFQFGMRHGMRPYTMGSAWWAGDCGPFWGHNALVRIRPFMEACELPVLPGSPPLGGAILSHDQIEAALMRRAGFEARVLPLECGSYEENPPTLLDFTRRDLRWCQGNMQYVKLLNLPGLKPMSRFQLVWAIMMFVGVPAWTLIILLCALKPLDGEDLGAFPAGSAAGLYIVFLLMYLAPKLAGFCDIALTPGALKRHGGASRFAAGCAGELAFSFLLGASTTLRTSLFMIGLLFGRSVVWGGQARDAHALPFLLAARGLWPQTVFGVVVIGLAALMAPSMMLWSLPLTLGYLVAIPFAMATASPGFGRWLVNTRLCATPEEFAPPAILDSLHVASIANDASSSIIEEVAPTIERAGLETI